MVLFSSRVKLLSVDVCYTVPNPSQNLPPISRNISLTFSICGVAEHAAVFVIAYC